VTKTDINVVYENNMIRFKLADPKTMSFGQITDVDNTVYNATEIRIHTPGEHIIKGDYFEMEIQVIHQSVKGIMR